MTREDGKRVRWWNVTGIVAFAAFLVYQLLRPEDMGLTSLQFWLAVAVGLLGLVLLPPGTLSVSLG